MDNVPESRNEAISIGAKAYYTGKPCKRGNVAFRNLKAECQCAPCIEANKDSKNKSAKNNRETRIIWEAQNKERVAEYKRAWQERNPNKSKVAIANWKSRNKAKIAARTRYDQIKLTGAVPPWYGEIDELVAVEAHDLAWLRRKTTGISWSVDHMIPLKSKVACGLHCADNLQVIPLAMNVKKHTKLQLTQPFEWLK